jgi:hypothetical protein
MEYGKAKKQIDDIQNNFEIYKERQIEQMNEMRIMLSSYAENSLSIERWEKESEIYNNAIIEKIHENIRKGILPQNAEVKKITCLIEQSLPAFWAFINDEDKKLSQQEIVVCCLIRLCFELSEIATILNISIQRVTNIKSSINKALLSEIKEKNNNANKAYQRIKSNDISKIYIESSRGARTIEEVKEDLKWVKKRKLSLYSQKQ